MEMTYGRITPTGARSGHKHLITDIVTEEGTTGTGTVTYLQESQPSEWNLGDLWVDTGEEI